MKSWCPAKISQIKQTRYDVLTGDLQRCWQADCVSFGQRSCFLFLSLCKAKIIDCQLQLLYLNNAIKLYLFHSKSPIPFISNLSSRNSCFQVETSVKTISLSVLDSRCRSFLSFSLLQLDPSCSCFGSDQLSPQLIFYSPALVLTST